MTLEYYNQDEPDTVRISKTEYKRLLEDAETLRILKEYEDSLLSNPVTNEPINQE